MCGNEPFHESDYEKYCDDCVKAGHHEDSTVGFGFIVSDCCSTERCTDCWEDGDALGKELIHCDQCKKNWCVGKHGCFNVVQFQDIGNSKHLCPDCSGGTKFCFDCYEAFSLNDKTAPFSKGFECTSCDTKHFHGAWMTAPFAICDGCGEKQMAGSDVTMLKCYDCKGGLMGMPQGGY
jgi:hypothetical protein